MQKYHSFHCCEKGANYLKNEDYAGHFDSDEVAIIAVADGHGSKDYFRSDKGSKFAVECAIDKIEQFVKDASSDKLSREKTRNELLKQLERSIISAWYERVAVDYTAQPFAEPEIAEVSQNAKNKYLAGERIENAYGTTLIAAAVTQHYWFAVQVGDGKCVTINHDGIPQQPIPPNDKCFLNSTTSICDSTAIDEFRECFGTEMPVAIFIGTDGIDGSYQNDEQLHQLYKSIAEIFKEKGLEGGKTAIDEFLPELTKKGSGDDVSLSGIILELV